MERRFLIVLAALCLVLGGAGTAVALNEQCAGCHAERVADVAASSHGALACQSCHEGAANHGGNMSLKTTVHFDLELCGSCHVNQYMTYKYGDSFATKYGGSPNLLPKTNPTNGFTHYNDIIDGQGFVKEYNEERGHNVMLLDHFDIKRGKFETCMQCKSTKLAYYWDSGKVLTVENDTFVKGGQMTDAQAVTVPKGTQVSMYTDRVNPPPGGAKPTHEARVLVTLPNGTVYKSYDLAALDQPTRDLNLRWTWATLYALTVNELTIDSPTRASGNGCNHCHDPHKVGRDPGSGGLLGFRLIRKSLIDAINRRGLNPYNPNNPSPLPAFDEEAFANAPLDLDSGIALCGQCHVEYVCGKSSIDNIDRDYFPWAKVFDLEGIYESNFPPYTANYYPFTTFTGKYVMDWKHGSPPWSSTPITPTPLSSPWSPQLYNTPFPIGEALIKSQHPEAETYWESRHYYNDARCYTCHMPKVTKVADGTTFTSHWIASPIKYMSTASVGPFAQTFGLQVDRSGIISPCGACHGGQLARMKDKAINIQDNTYAKALTVESALVASLRAIKAAKDNAGNAALIADAVEDHQAAHVRWENLVVSENSMGFHFPVEIDDELTNALALAQSAKTKADSSYTPVAPLIITTGSQLPNGRLNTNYSTTLAATGGVTPYAWAVISGSLPPGLTLGATAGTISGKPTAKGTFTFRVQVTDSKSTKASKDFSLMVK